ncbi:hypothetical protein BYT27DRAFT_6650780 [Phlegmacium glaucopus]|nr:hypothetical protein BYT27DRAFT_6650780 [Phlegmacium glaucopus]
MLIVALQCDVGVFFIVSHGYSLFSICSQKMIPLALYCTITTDGSGHTSGGRELRTERIRLKHEKTRAYASPCSMHRPPPPPPVQLARCLRTTSFPRTGSTTGSTFDFLKLPPSESSWSNSTSSATKTAGFGDKKPIINGPRSDVAHDDAGRNITSILNNFGKCWLLYSPFNVIGTGRIMRASREVKWSNTI